MDSRGLAKELLKLIKILFLFWKYTLLSLEEKKQ